jgi:hypothetical protein
VTPCCSKEASARWRKPVTVAAFSSSWSSMEARAGAVVDERVRVVVADPRLGPHPGARALRAVTGDAVARPEKARVAARVHVQEIARGGPFVAVGRLLGCTTLHLRPQKRSLGEPDKWLG